MDGIYEILSLAKLYMVVNLIMTILFIIGVVWFIIKKGIIKFKRKNSFVSHELERLEDRINDQQREIDILIALTKINYETKQNVKNGSQKKN